MSGPEPIKVTPKQRIAELQATIAFLTSARNTLVNAGSVLKGENDKLKSALSIIEKKLGNLQHQYDQDEQEFTGTINDLENMTTEVQKLNTLIVGLERNLAYADAVSKDNYNNAMSFQTKYYNADAKAFTYKLATFLLAAPYVYAVAVWIIEHVRICLH